MKIVVAVESDKETIIKKTGQAAFFAIFENDQLLELVKNGHAQGEAHHKHEHMKNTEHTLSHKKDIMGLSGCDIILVQALGENMKNALISIGLEVKKVRKKDGVTAYEVVKNFLDGNI